MNGGVRSEETALAKGIGSIRFLLQRRRYIGVSDAGNFEDIDRVAGWSESIDKLKNVHEILLHLEDSPVLKFVNAPGFLLAFEIQFFSRNHLAFKLHFGSLAQRFPLFNGSFVPLHWTNCRQLLAPFPRIRPRLHPKSETHLRVRLQSIGPSRLFAFDLSQSNSNKMDEYYCGTDV